LEDKNNDRSENEDPDGGPKAPIESDNGKNDYNDPTHDIL
jgi:hypothetical protein